MSTTHNHAAAIGTKTPSGMTSYPGYRRPEMHLGKFLTTRTFKAGE